MKHIVLFSGGINSWATAKRVAHKYGTDNLILLFTDTLIEDEDLYRFLIEAAQDVGGELVWLKEGRSPWEVFFDNGFIGNARADTCSQTLKRRLTRKWLNANCNPADTIIYIGIDWSEEHRYTQTIDRWKPYTIKAPLCDPPYADKEDLMGLLAAQGIEVPRLYKMGFPHNNCGGFCIKAGRKQFAHLLELMPERYAYHEEMEEKFRETFQKDVAILTTMKDYQKTPYTLKQLRLDIQTPKKKDDDEWEYDWGGCGCFNGDD